MFSILFRWPARLFLSRRCTVSVTGTVYCVEIGKCESSNFFLLLKFVLAIWGPLQCHINCRINLSISEKQLEV